MSYHSSSVELNGVRPNLSELRSTLLRYCLALTGSKWDAEDLVQDVCLKVLPMIQNTPDKEFAQAYMFKAARNRWIDHVRRHKVLSRKLEDFRPDPVLQEEVDQSEIAEAVVRVLSCLSPLQRCVFLLRDVLGYSSPEVALKLNMTEGAVKSVLYRARTALAALRGQPIEISHELNEDREQLKAEVQQYLQALSREDAAMLIQLMHNEVGDPSSVVNVFKNRQSLRQGGLQKAQGMDTGAPSNASFMAA
ncbi:RNA polymerase sigma factor [Paenibacillus tuaregi]|uniref:RNA polymerase sigma factor n=1 Tax=Paenibacillus tuaregi TaxID=1816681 RepID=UPI00083839FD|nr:RNA polymerase sigma factor [Paenibacillus tuaregi]